PSGSRDPFHAAPSKASDAAHRPRSSRGRCTARHPNIQENKEDPNISREQAEVYVAAASSARASLRKLTSISFSDWDKSMTDFRNRPKSPSSSSPTPRP